MKFNHKISSQIIKLTLPLTSLVLLLSCTEELSIADFADDFKNYEQELRIEGLIDGKDFSQSIVRVDRTILVTDTSLFNGVDDNGDWVPYTDSNGNGRWDVGEPLNDDIGGEFQGPDVPPLGQGNGIPDPGEPHVDDYIEILPQIHDSTMTSVVLREKGSQAFVAEFEWQGRAGSFDQLFGPGGPPEKVKESPSVRYYYGAYVPMSNYDSLDLDLDLEYELELITGDGRIISATTDLVDIPSNISWEGTSWDGDTLVARSDNYATMTWNTPENSYFCGVYLDEFYHPDSTRGFYASLAASIGRDLETDLPSYPGNFVGVPLGIYKLTFESFNGNYGRYVYSGLQLRDRELSNWRDQNGNVVLGILGSKAPLSFYLRIVSPNG